MTYQTKSIAIATEGNLGVITTIGSSDTYILPITGSVESNEIKGEVL